jgi:uncharacterized protein YkwD
MQNKKTYIFLLCSVLFFVLTLQASGYAGKQPKADLILERLNQARKVAGLAPLLFDEQLSRAAADKAEDMISQGYFNHVSPQGQQPWEFIENLNYAFVAAGENLAINFTNAEDLVQAWLASDTHRNNILNPVFTHTGINVISANTSSGQKTVIVQYFTRPE